jgi:hypothetical protein
VSLSDHVEPGGGLVQDHERWSAGKGSRNQYALLLATRQLVRVAPEEGAVAWQQHLLHKLLQALTSVGSVAPDMMNTEHLIELSADPPPWVECGARVLRDVGDDSTANLPQFPRRQRQKVLGPDSDLTGLDLQPTLRETKQRERQSRFAAP